MNLNKILAETISKTAAKAVRKPVAGLRRDVAMLKREVADLKRLVKALGRQAPAAVRTEAEGQEPPNIRPSAKMVLALRKKLGLTQAQLASLVGVSNLTVSKWETADGRLHMRGPALAGFARVRAMGKREAKKAMAETVSSGK